MDPPSPRCYNRDAAIRRFRGGNMGARMLIVEDETDIRFVLKSNFSKDGYDVEAAKDAESALKIARKQDPEIVISDIMLPGMSGLDMLPELRRFNGAPVLFLFVCLVVFV